MSFKIKKKEITRKKNELTKAIKSEIIIKTGGSKLEKLKEIIEKWLENWTQRKKEKKKEMKKLITE